MVNYFMNDGDKCLIFDTRSTYDILRSHINFNFMNDTNVFLPSDYMLEN